MSAVNLVLVLSLVGLIFFNLHSLNLRMETWSYIMQFLSAGVGVFIGMYADKSVESDRNNIYLKNALSLIKTELINNRSSLISIRNFVLSRPSLQKRAMLPFRDVYSMSKFEEKMIGDYAKKLEDRSYYAFLSSLPTLNNPLLLNSLSGVYTAISTVKLAFNLFSPEENTSTYTDQQVQGLIQLADDSSNNKIELLNSSETNVLIVVGVIDTVLKKMD